jgi:DNA-cytosine methyltransferase
VTLTVGSLFSGAAGLDRAVESVLDARTAWHAEIDPAACKVLAHRYPDVPNLGDVTGIDWATVPPVDVICGGSPCQDVSHAGQRRGMRAGTRSGLWAAMCDAIDIIRPALVVWENVRGVLSAEADSAMEPCAGCVGDADDGAVLRALGRVVGDLASIGYVGRWHGLRAADVGAPHGRFRVFVVAWDANSAAGRLGDRLGPPAGAGRSGEGEARSAVRGIVGGPSGATADPDDAGLEGHGRLHGRTSRRTVRLGSTQSQPCSRRQCTSDHSRTVPQPGTDYSSLPNAVMELLPTPSVSDGTGGHRNRSGDRKDELLLPGIVLTLLPTPMGAERQRVEEGIDATGHWSRPGSSRQLGDSARGDATELSGASTNPRFARWEHVLGRPAPAPTELAPRGGQRLSPRFVEWMLGWPDGWVTDVPGISRNDALKICGNGVVPQQAAEALRRMLALEAQAA